MMPCHISYHLQSLPMPKSVTKRFTHNHKVQDDGSLTFECSDDMVLWPWLALPPYDPIVIQTINYWVPVETGETKKTFDRTKWTALTTTKWSCGEPGVGHVVRGVAAPTDESERLNYKIRFYDASDRLVYVMSGDGVVFQNRDFETWRDQAKLKIAKLQKPQDFKYAPADLVGAELQSESYISPLIQGENISAMAYITKDNGFIPAHRHISGSGDHVNSTHLADIGLQFACLLNDGAKLSCVGGAMEFNRFVELDYPLEITLAGDRRANNAVDLTIHQVGKLCASLTIKYELGKAV